MHAPTATSEVLRQAPPLRPARASILPLAVCVALVALGVTVSAWANPFLLDSRMKVVQNPDIRNLSELPGRLVYPYGEEPQLARNDPSRPLVFAHWGVLYHFFGLDPVPFHVLNALLHALSAVLVFFLARRVLAGMGRSASVRAPPGGAASLRLGPFVLPDVVAFVAALFFAVLPIQTGTVIYVYGLSDVLSTALCLGAIVLYLGPRTRGRLLGALACQALALLTKQSAVTIPLFLFAFDWALEDAGGWRERVKRVLPFVALSAAYLVWRKAYFGAIGDLEGAAEREPFLDYLVVQPLVLLRYLWLTVVPRGLAIDHHVPPGADPVWLKAVAACVVAAVLAGTVYLARRPTPLRRRVVLGVACFVLALAPTSSILPTVDPMVERRVYLGMLGVLLIGALAFHALLLRAAAPADGAVGEERAWRTPRWLLGASALALVVYAGVSLHRNDVFSTRRGVWEEVLALYPNSARALNNHGVNLMDEGDYDGALTTLEHLAALDGRPLPLLNLGRLYDTPEWSGHAPDRALDLYERAIAAGADQAWVYLRVARLHHVRRELDQARRCYSEALERTPDDAGALNDFGVLWIELGNPVEAGHCFERALRADPGFLGARENLIRLRQDGT